MSMFTWSIHYKFILSDWHIFCIDRLVSVIPWSWDSCSQVSCHSRRHLAATIATVQCKLATGLPGLPDGRIQRFFFAKGESNGKHVSLFSVNAWAKGMVSIPSRIIGGHWVTGEALRQDLTGNGSRCFHPGEFGVFALDSLQPTGDEEAARRKLKEKAGEIQGDDTARLLRHLAWQGLARWGMDLLQITSKSSCNNFWSRSTPESVLKIFQGSYSIVWTEIAFLSNQKQKESTTKSFRRRWSCWWFTGVLATSQDL